MRVLRAGATGVIGARLVPLLVAEGHTVAGMTRSSEKADPLRELGAEPVLCDVYDAERLTDAIRTFAPRPGHAPATDLPDDLKRLVFFIRRNNRIRNEGTRNLLAAARAGGAQGFIAQSIAFTAPGAMRAVARHERMVLDAGGVILRYGYFYGPGTLFGNSRLVPRPRVHVDEAARRTVELLHAPSGVVEIAEAKREPQGRTAGDIPLAMGPEP